MESTTIRGLTPPARQRHLGTSFKDESHVTTCEKPVGTGKPAAESDEASGDEGADATEFRVTRKSKSGRELTMLDSLGGATFTIDAQWLVVSIADFPPAELIVQPLFPKFTVEVTDDKGTRTYSRTSVRSISAWDCMPLILYGVLAESGLVDLIELLPFSI